MNQQVVTFFLIIFVMCTIAMGVADEFIKNEITPYGIVSFEFISSLSSVNRVMQIWGENGRAAVGFSLGIDYLFILAYSVLTIFFLRNTSSKVSVFSPTLHKLFSVLIYVFPVAALCDAIENFGLLKLLFGSQHEVWVLVAYYCAVVKFSIVAISGISLLYGQSYAFIKR